MKRVRRAWNRLVGVFAGSRRETELASEIETHLQMQTEDNLRLGMPPAEARRQAVLKFGSVESIKEDYRDQRGLPRLETVGRDVRLALRAMRRNPGFTMAVISSLGLGIAATVAIFSVADAVLLRSLPYGDPSRLATVSIDSAMTAPLFETLRRQARSLEQAALFEDFQFDLSGVGEPERIAGARVSPQLFEMLGVAPRLGRAFTASEDRPGNQRVVLLGDTLWKTRFGGDPGVVGRTITLNGAAHTIVGVMPPGFAFPNGPELPSTVGPFPSARMWRPMALADSERTCGGCFNFAMLARLRPGVTAAQAQAEMDGIDGRVRPNRRIGITVRALDDAVTARVRPPILILFGAVTVALLISCLNVASLLLARGLRRQGEMALRISLGATRGRVMGQLLTEAMMLALLAGAVALPLAWAGMRAMVALAPAGIPRLNTVTLDGRLLAFTLGVSLASALLFGTVPALIAARRQPSDVLKDGVNRSTAARSVALRLLVVAEFALSLVLLVASVLLAASYLAAADTPLGFRPDHVLTLRTSLPGTERDDQKRVALVDRIVAGCATLPGVTAAAAVSTLPLTDESEGWGLVTEDHPDMNQYVMSRARAVTPGYFRTMGIRLLAGRDIAASDRGRVVGVVSAMAARRLWPGVANPVGRRLFGHTPMTIIGVVDDTRASGLDNEVRPYIYVPFWVFTPGSFAVTIRADGNLPALVSAVKAEVWRVVKDQPVTHVEPMSAVVADSIGSRWFQFVLMATFGVFATALAAIGIYGVLSYAVAQRAREIGIRLALGASRGGVVSVVMRQAAVLAGIGAAVGVLAAWRLAPLLRAVLYGVTALDTRVFVGAAIVLLAIASLAGLVPACRAARLDPASSLRSE